MKTNLYLRLIGKNDLPVSTWDFTNIDYSVRVKLAWHILTSEKVYINAGGDISHNITHTDSMEID